MAPKASKRVSSQAAKDVRPPKAAKVDPLFEGVINAVESAKDLPEPCKAMLVATIPISFATPAAERHEAQAAVVRMVGEVIEATLAKLREDLDAEEARVSDADVAKAKLEAAVGAAESTLATVIELEEACKKSLSETSEVVVSKKAELSNAEAARRAGSAAYDAAKGAKESFETVLESHFKALRDGEEDGGKPCQDAKVHYDKLMPLVSKIGLDESLLTAFPSSAAKAPKARGPFDQMVIEQLEKSLEKHIAHLGESVNAAAPEAARLAALVEDAERAVEDAKACQQEASGKLDEAQTRRKDAVADVATAKDALATNQVAHTTATKERSEKEDALKKFQTWNVESYNHLREKTVTGTSISPKKDIPDAPVAVAVNVAGA